MKRETFGSRLGFILVSAGCAVGIGNVWKFPYMCGQFGGAAFILIYLVFLLIMGIPVMVCEFGVGRASRHSVAAAYETLEPQGTKWHITKWIGIIGCYFLMMFYTTVGGWMLYYCVRSFSGDFVGADMETVSAGFSDMLGNMPLMTFWTILICIIGFGVCAFGIQKGIEKVSKFMMTALLLIMIVLAIHSVMMKGAGAGIRFYLIPDFRQMAEIGIGNVIFGAMSQAFFTLSIGIGAMLIFGSYMEKDQRLFGEAVNITVLDTVVALMAGFIIIPACFAYGIEPGAGPSLIFITIPNIFAQVAGGRVWGGLFFLFLSFAAFTTLVAVFENIISFDMDLFGWSRKKSTLVSLILIIILSMPCVMGFNVLAGFTPLGEGSTIMDLEDFIVSNNLLPLGSLGYVLFCTKKNGWGWNHFLEEINQGEGWKFPSGIKGYMSYGLPLLIIIIYLKGYYDKFQPMGTKVLVGWMIVAILFLTFVIGCSCGKSNAEKVDK
ncbi:MULTISPECIES: sodium-dependent transporter [Dorea]|jgi:NSS family neurotransmitter:Na+ symporter|uniref:Sodium-dependent transporter n=1 Tax=Dorea longicatena TaxID=88431 RepID=A0A414S1H6_9FIRM|nr:MULTISPECIES: sodium-dependent transporter [Dorea]RHG07888.1 sodium-dependent transporter [Dorea longicatena]RHG23668.1 sodium-dependent transporter [Dorea longicatena]